MSQPTHKPADIPLPLLIGAYNTLMLGAAVTGLPALLPMVMGIEKRRRTFSGRLGRRPAWPACDRGRPPIWVHALSVGEVISAIPLVEAIRRADPDTPLVFSASTLTGYQTAAGRLERRVDHLCYFPYDWPTVVRRAFSRIQPSRVVIVESDIWPNFLATAARLSIPVHLVNARLSERSLNGYRRVAMLFRPLFNSLSAICCQSDIDKKRFLELGVADTRLHVTGNLKFDQEPPPMSREDISDLRRRLGLKGVQRVLLGGSTHPGEERALLSVYRRLKEAFPGLVLVLAPRDPRRAGDVLAVCNREGMEGRLLSAIDPDAVTGGHVVIVDRMGILARLYALAELAFIGGSLVPEGGHNPLEAAAFSKPVAFGPDMRDFLSISRMLVEGGGAVRVADEEILYREAAALLADPDAANRMGTQGRRIFDTQAGAADRVVDHILDPGNRKQKETAA